MAVANQITDDFSTVYNKERKSLWGNDNSLIIVVKSPGYSLCNSVLCVAAKEAVRMNDYMRALHQRFFRLSVQGGEMKVPPGRYSVVAYNYNTEVVRIRGEESYETIEAHTGYCNGLGIAGTEKMVWSPDPLYVLNIDELKIKKSDEVFHLDWKLESVIKNYSFAIEVKGLEYVTSVIGCVNGLSDCYCIGKGCGMCNSQPIYFEAKKEGGKVIAHFTAFKGAKDIPTRMSMLGEPVYREASSVKLILSFVRTDNTIQERTIDVTEIIGTLEKDEEEEAGKQDPPPEIELPPDDKIEVEKPETPPNPDGGGGMNGNVDGWGPEDNVELPVN